MIVLVVIGVLTGILVPAAMNSMPNENVMKFKKAHNTLYRVINELVSSDKYYADGDLGKRPNGDLIDGTHTGDKTYFCNTFADVLNVKSRNCSEYEAGTYHNHFHIYWYKEIGDTSQNVDGLLDEACQQETASVGEEIVTSDGIVYYQPSPLPTFGTWVFYHTQCHDLSDPTIAANCTALGIAPLARTVYKPFLHRCRWNW